MSKKFILGVLISMAVGGSTSAGVGSKATRSPRLVTITNDRDSNYIDVAATADAAGDLQSLIYTTHAASGSVMSQKNFTLGQLTSGVILEEGMGIKGILLSVGAARAGARTLMFKYIVNALASRYKDCPVTLRLPSGGGWSLKNASGATVTSAKITSGTVGLTGIRGLCN